MNCNGVILDSELLNLSSVCRNFGTDNMTIEYYVDPLSTEPMELGTFEYPYRSFKAMNFELISLFSHSVNPIISYTKTCYLEDGTNHYINMSSFSILPHPGYSELIMNPALIATSVPQPIVHQKALLHLLDADKVDLKEARQVAVGNEELYIYERLIMEAKRTTIMPVRTSLSIKGVDLYREETRPDEPFIFLRLVNLQQRELRLESIDLNITGKFIVSDRPANVMIEHIQADLAKLHTFYSSERMECNYPEANLEATIHFNNFSFVNSDINNGRAPKDILRLNEVGNITVQNIDCRNYFSYLSDYNG